MRRPLDATRSDGPGLVGIAEARSVEQRALERGGEALRHSVVSLQQSPIEAIDGHAAIPGQRRSKSTGRIFSANAEKAQDDHDDYDHSNDINDVVDGGLLRRARFSDASFRRRSTPSSIGRAAGRFCTGAHISFDGDASVPTPGGRSTGPAPKRALSWETGGNSPSRRASASGNLVASDGSFGQPIRSGCRGRGVPRSAQADWHRMPARGWAKPAARTTSLRRYALPGAVPDPNRPPALGRGFRARYMTP